MRVNPVIWLVLLWVALTASEAFAQPRAALPYRNSLIREARAEWGLTAPVALFAGQIEQESAWNPRACSPYACGLAQFTPATAAEVGRRITIPNDVFNPAWAIRALVLYDHELHAQLDNATTDCDRWAFTLSAYNGGLGNVRKDVRLCTAACDQHKWFGNVENHSQRSAANFRENRAYPATILGRRQLTYSTWGAIIPCPSSLPA